MLLKAFLSLFLFFSFHISAQQTRRMTFAEKKEISRQIEQLEEAQVDAISENIRKKEAEELEAWDNLELKKTILRIFRQKALEIYQSKLKQPEQEAAKVGIIGSSATDYSEEGLNIEVFNDLLELMKTHEPRAVFFLGNLTSGLKINQDSKAVTTPKTKDIFGKAELPIKGKFNADLFKKRLNRFSGFVQKALGDIPVFPVVGEHEAMNEEAFEIFREHFHIENDSLLDNGQFVYTVAVDHTLFILIATDYYDKETGRTIGHRFSPAMRTWLEAVLKQQAPKFWNIFVLGNDPAFLSSQSFIMYQNIDQGDQREKDLFWDLLRRYKVTAYISGSEVLYDRSFRKGIWQIISGGGGQISDFKTVDDDLTFYHFLMLSIPGKPNANSLLEVFDLNNEKRDSVLLSRDPLIYQFRIFRKN
jgi:hypothetical protein